MIENVRTEGFKGFDINEPVPLKAIYTGKNKSGKSTRAGAIAIALYGHIPFSTAGKLPGDILNSFGNEQLIAAVKVNGVEFGRKFSRNGKGGVSQSMQVDGKRQSKENFAILLDRAGAPRIANIAEFMKQSESKKIDTLFDLFPNDELASIDTEIEEAKEDVSRLEKKKTGAESTVIRLTNSKQNIEIPSGSVAEVQAEIKTVETQIEDLEKQIKQVELEEAKAKGEQEGKKKAEKEATEKQISKPGIDYSTPPLTGSDDSIMHPHNKACVDKVLQRFDDPNDFLSIHQDVAAASIQKIIGALIGAGCGTCAALIVAKQELKKFKGAL